MADDKTHGERLARLEEQMKHMDARVGGMEKKLWGAVAVVLAFVWSKVSAVLGIGGVQ